MRTRSQKPPMKPKQQLTPLLDTLPLSLASKFAPNDKEAKLCIDLAFSITQGSPTAKKFYDSGEARATLSERAYNALGEVLTSVEKYFSDLRAKRQLWFEPPGSSSDTDEVVPVKKRGRADVKKSVKKEAKGKEYGAKRKGKGKVGMWLLKGLAPLLPAAADEDKLVIDPTDPNFEADLGHPGCPKYVMYVETEIGFKKYRVYEDYDSDLSSLDADGKVRDIPMSPPVSEEWDPNEHAFLVLKKRPVEESSGQLVLL